MLSANTNLCVRQNNDALILHKATTGKQARSDYENITHYSNIISPVRKRKSIIYWTKIPLTF